MIKWYDELIQIIDDLKSRVEKIVAEEVDAKNLSEVLDKDAPILISTDLENNKVKLGVDIDENTMEIENGKLKAKSTGGSGKYSHRISLIIRQPLITDLHTGEQFKIGFNIINNKNTNLTKQDLVDYINNHGNQYVFGIDDINGCALLTDGCVIAKEIGRQSVSQTSCNLIVNKLKYDSTNGLVCSNVTYNLQLSDTADYYWAILSDTIEAL